MTLPPISRLTDHPSASWRALAKRLAEIGLTPARVAPIVGAVEPLHPVQRRPVRAHLLHKVREPVGFAMRALLFNDPVSESEAHKAFRDRTGELLQTGILVKQADGRLVSPFTMSLFNDLFVISDDISMGGDGVMGFGGGTVELCRAAFPEKAVGRVLDMGCGAGTCGLVLASAATRVIATDIHPRAVELARVNARLNGIANIDVRQGDMFAPVAGETFDLIVSQPPFVPMSEGAETATFLHGGAVGDEIALRLLAGLAQHLAPGGRAVLRVDWPEHGTGTLEQRLRAAAGPELDLLILKAPPITADDHATAYAASLFPTLGEGFEAEALRRREHLDAKGIREVSPTLTVLSRPGSKPVQTGTLEIGPLARVGVTSDRIDKILAARALAKDPNRLLAATLRVPADTVFEQEQLGVGGDAQSTIRARFAPQVLIPPMPLTPELLFLVTFVHEATDVEGGIAAFAEQNELAADDAKGQLLPEIARALAGGLLQVAP